MPTVHDVAAYILQKQGPLTAMKLQKLCFFSQAFSLAFLDDPLFPEEIEAWVNGPIVRALWNRHAGAHNIKQWKGDPTALPEDKRSLVDTVLYFYGNLPAQELSRLTHEGRPWLDARNGIGPKEPSQQVISHDAMKMFYRQTFLQ